MFCSSPELWQDSLEQPHPEDVSPQGGQCNSAWAQQSAGMHNTCVQNVPGVLHISVGSSLTHQHCLQVSGCYSVRLGSAAAAGSGKPSRAEEPRAGASTI